MIVLRLVERDEITLFWPKLKPYFARIAAKVTTEITPATIFDGAKDRRLLLWAIHDDGQLLGAAATGVRDCGDDTVAFIEALAGDEMDRWLIPVLEDFEIIARERGATIVEHEGRLGWARKLPGWKPTRIVMQKVL